MWGCQASRSFTFIPASADKHDAVVEETDQMIGIEGESEAIGTLLAPHPADNRGDLGPLGIQ